MGAKVGEARSFYRERIAASDGKEDFMNEQQANEPYLGQRCHVEGKGFGTIVKLSYDEALRKPIARVELDGHASNWYELDKLELLGSPTFRAKSE